jgi:hypothetical protein
MADNRSQHELSQGFRRERGAIQDSRYGLQPPRRPLNTGAVEVLGGLTTLHNDLIQFATPDREDIRPLTEFFVAKFAASLNKPIDSTPDEVIEVLKAHDCPGNIRELQPIRDFEPDCDHQAFRVSEILVFSLNWSKPLPLPHAQDQNNWNAFQSATELLMPDLGFVEFDTPAWPTSIL